MALNGFIRHYSWTSEDLIVNEGDDETKVDDKEKKNNKYENEKIIGRKKKFEKEMRKKAMPILPRRTISIRVSVIIYHG